MLTDPGHVLNDDRSAIPLLVTTKPSDQTSISGHRTALVRGSHQHTDLLVPATTDAVTVTVESPRADVWERYFEQQETGSMTRTSDTTVEFVLDDGETSVSVTWIRLRLV